MPIHYAVDMANKEICERLFEHKANPNGSCDDGQLNPYEIASDNGDEDFLEYLKPKGCQKNHHRNYKKQTPSSRQCKSGFG